MIDDWLGNVFQHSDFMLSLAEHFWEFKSNEFVDTLKYSQFGYKPFLNIICNKHTTISILTDSPCQRASRVVAGPLTDLVTRTGWPWKAGTACFDKALSMAPWMASRACKSDYDVSYIHALWAVNNWQCPATFLVFLISEIWAIPILWKCMCSTKWCYLTYTMGSSKAHSCYSCIWNFLIE